MKKIAGLNAKMLTVSAEESNEKMPTVRSMFQMIGNPRGENADESRRIRRIIMKLRDKDVDEIILDTEDLAFLEKTIEKNSVGYTGWAQGQLLEIIASAERIELKAV